MTRSELLLGTLRVFTSLLVAVTFLLFLVVASAQQQAVASLEGAKVDVSYSVARKTLGEVAEYRKKLLAAQERSRKATTTETRLQAQLGGMKIAYYKEMEIAREIANSIQRSGRCSRFSKEAGNGVPDEGPALWNGINSCAAEDAVPPQVATSIKALQNPNRNPAELWDRISRVGDQVSLSARQKEDATKDVSEISEKIDRAQSAVDAMEDIRVLESSWILSRLFLTAIPPSLMQIFLSFTSGLFGSLLLTLILAVYPNNDLRFAAGKGYWNRILLGGLISVSVFVVVGGGVAVLGSRDTMSTGSSNYLAFCAIGILAGMFSDRVAKWLSDRAQLFVNPSQANR